jgi:hypothetical protein
MELISRASVSLVLLGFRSKKSLRFKRILLNDKRSVASDVKKFIKKYVERPSLATEKFKKLF